MASPCERVLSITELFEHILLELSLADLLFAQLVCKDWRIFILTSSPLTQRLYYRPANQAPFPERLHFHGRRACNSDSWGCRSGPRKARYRVSPLLKSTFNGWYYNIKGLSVLTANPAYWTLARGPYAEPNASWRDMLAVQPAATTLIIHKRGLNEHLVDGDGPIVSITSNPTGITMCQLHEALMKAWSDVDYGVYQSLVKGENPQRHGNYLELKVVLM